MRDEEVPWGELKGGYGVTYDPRPALAAIEAGEDRWEELWQELYHQGDVGDASYAAVPIIARIAEAATQAEWHPFALAATIEEARLSGRNPPLPAWLEQNYASAWDRLFRTALGLIAGAEDELLSRSLLAVLAMHKGHALLGMMAMLSEDEQREMLDATGGV